MSQDLTANVNDKGVKVERGALFRFFVHIDWNFVVNLLKNYLICTDLWCHFSFLFLIVHSEALHWLVIWRPQSVLVTNSLVFTCLHWGWQLKISWFLEKDHLFYSIAPNFISLLKETYFNCLKFWLKCLVYVLFALNLWILF